MSLPVFQIMILFNHVIPGDSTALYCICICSLKLENMFFLFFVIRIYGIILGTVRSIDFDVRDVIRRIGIKNEAYII